MRDEGFKGHWGIMVDVLYGQLEKDKDYSGGVLPGSRQFKMNQSLVELAIPYWLNWNPVVADVFVGGWYNYIYGEIGIPSVPVKRDDTLAFVVGAPGMDVSPGVGLGAPGVGISPGPGVAPMNPGGPVNRVGVR